MNNAIFNSWFTFMIWHQDKVDDDKYERQLRQHKENEQTRKQHGNISNMIGGGANMAFLNSKTSDPINSTVFISNVSFVFLFQQSNCMSFKWGYFVFEWNVETIQDGQNIEIYDENKYVSNCNKYVSSISPWNAEYKSLWNCWSTSHHYLQVQPP